MDSSCIPEAAVSSLTDLCRVCLQLPDESQILDSRLIYDEDENLSYAECFAICTQIDLNDEDVPQNLCKPCGLELQMAYDFFKKVECSQKLLEQMKEEEHQEAEEVPRKMSNAQPEELGASHMDESDMLVEHLESDETEERLQLEEFLDINEDTSNEDAETVRVNVSTKYDDEEFVIEAIGLDVDEAVDADLTGEANSWKQAVVTVANESHLPVSSTSKLEEYSPATSSKIAQIQSTNNQTEEKRKRHIGTWSCDFCNKVFPNFSRMKLHRRSHEDDRLKFPCAHCDRIYATKQARDVHVRTVHQKTGFTCSVCNKIYAIKKSLEVHMRYHTGDFPYVCDLCGRKFAQMCHLNTHKSVKHDSSRFCCEYPDCGKFFTSSSSLRNHEFSHSDMPFECEYCHHGYPSKSKLKVHIRRKHGKELTLDQLEHMRKFHVLRSKLNLVRIVECED